MKLAGKIRATQRRLESYGITPTHITMGRKFHDALLAEVGAESAADFRTIFGMQVTVSEEAFPDACYMGQSLE